MVLQVVLAEVLLGTGVAREGAIAEGGLGVPLHPRLAEDHWDAGRDLRGGSPADGRPSLTPNTHHRIIINQTLLNSLLSIDQLTASTIFSICWQTLECIPELGHPMPPVSFPPEAGS